ncbi:MAG: hypothetical protein ACREOE_13635 [Gemmatimonadales bacterium]
MQQIHSSAWQICSRLTSELARYQTYQPRLSAALRHIEVGEHQWLIAHPSSYHTTWLELHEDLVTIRGDA